MFMAHALMENRNGLLVDFLVSDATGTAEQDAVPVLLDERANAGSIRRLSARTRATTRGVAWGPCASAGSPRTWRNTRAGAPALSMDARPGIAAMRSVSV